MEHVELFCEKLVVLVKGKSVLQGYLKDIKDNYKKKNIFVKGDIIKEEVEKLKGVVSVTKTKDEYVISIKSIDYINEIFKKISVYENITKFSVEDPTLNEIFISTVGDSYEK